MLNDAPYVVSEMSASSYEAVSSTGGVFVLGDDNSTKSRNDFTDRYQNGPLQEGTPYSVFVWAFVQAIPLASVNVSCCVGMGCREVGGGGREGGMEGGIEGERSDLFPSLQDDAVSKRQSDDGTPRQYTVYSSSGFLPSTFTERSELTI